MLCEWYFYVSIDVYFVYIILFLWDGPKILDVEVD
jgi:hypothetical protein